MNTDVLTIGDKAIVKKKSKIDKSEYTTQIQDYRWGKYKDFNSNV